MLTDSKWRANGAKGANGEGHHLGGDSPQLQIAFLLLSLQRMQGLQFLYAFGTCRAFTPLGGEQARIQ